MSISGTTDHKLINGIGLFRLLVKIGFKEIEVAYPSSSEQEYQFCRSLIENGEVPDDVALQVITKIFPGFTPFSHIPSGHHTCSAGLD